MHDSELFSDPAAAQWDLPPGYRPARSALSVYALGFTGGQRMSGYGVEACTNIGLRYAPANLPGNRVLVRNTAGPLLINSKLVGHVADRLAEAKAVLVNVPTGKMGLPSQQQFSKFRDALGTDTPVSDILQTECHCTVDNNTVASTLLAPVRFIREFNTQVPFPSTSVNPLVRFANNLAQRTALNAFSRNCPNPWYPSFRTRSQVTQRTSILDVTIG